MPKDIPTLSDVAHYCGVSLATASYALRGDARIKISTRMRITEAAKAIGYVPNVVAATLAHQRQSKCAPTLPIAYVYRSTPAAKLPLPAIFHGAQTRAAELGYHLDAFDVQKSDTLRLSQRLYHRGYSGIIFGRLSPSNVQFDWEWDKFSAVACGHEQAFLGLHTIAPAVNIALVRLMDIALQKGYRRIGVALWSHHPRLPDDDLRLGALLTMQNLHIPKNHRIPPLILPESGSMSSGFRRDPAALKVWARKWRCDCILGFNEADWDPLRELGYGTRPDLGFAALSVDPKSSKLRQVAGMDLRLPGMGSKAMEFLDTEMRFRRTGKPSCPGILALDPVFFNGSSFGQ